MEKKNISQATYNRMHAALCAGGAFTRQDCKDLLRAYEDAMELLDRVCGEDSTSRGTWRDVEEFLFLENGQPRVRLDGADEATPTRVPAKLGFGVDGWFR